MSTSGPLGSLYDADYREMREGAAAFEAVRDFLVLSGPDALDYMQGQCSQDLSSLEPGQSVDALVLEPQGKINSMVRVTRSGDAELLVDVAGGWGDHLEGRLRRFMLRVRVTMERRSWRVISLRGAKVLELIDRAQLPAGTALVLDVPWPQIVGVDLVGETPEVPSGVRRCMDTAWDAVRIEAGLPVMGAELDGRTIPTEAGLIDNCVSMTKGCYTGQELVARLDARANRVPRRLQGVVAGRSVALGCLAAGTELCWQGRGNEARDAGRVTSAAWSPGMQAMVGLAYVRREVPVPGSVEALGRPGCPGRLAVEVRNLPMIPPS